MEVDQANETPTGKGRFDDDDVWGDAAEDPMAALNAMTDDNILAQTKEFESEMRRLKQ